MPTSDAPFPWKAFFSLISVLAMAFLPIGLLLPQPDLRVGEKVYPSDVFLLASCACGISSWVLCKVFSPPLSKLLYFGLSIGVVSGLIFVFIVYLSGAFAYRT